MFDSGVSGQSGAQAPGVLAGVPESEWTVLLRERHAAIARAQFLEVDAVASVYLARCAADARRGCNEAFQGEFAHTEVAVMLTVTEPVARRWIALGLDLRWRLHGTSAAFAAGRIDQARAQAVSEALANVSDDKIERIEALLLDGIDAATTTSIRRTARRLIARHDPDGAQARREHAEADRDIRFRGNDDGTCSVEGTLPGPAGQIVAMRLRAMCLEVCAKDPRTYAQRRADALVALADGSGRLHCRCDGQCGRKAPTDTARERAATGCESAVPDGTENKAAPALPPLPAATIHVGVNATTLLGLDDRPGYLAGHGWIDAGLARSLAADATWRKVLTLTDTDRDALLDALCGNTGHGTAETTIAEAMSDQEWLSHRRGDTPAPGAVLGIGRALAAAGITASAVRARSRPRHEQLTYRPTHRVAEIVRARDGNCRFPGCTVRALACDLDHTIPFDQANPASGGWTVEQNLACLCRRHHRMKTVGRCAVRQLGGGRLEWTMATGEHVITEPTGEFSAEQSPHHGAGIADADIAAALGVELTEPATLEHLFGQPNGSGIEDDLKYILDAMPVAVPEPAHISSSHHPARSNYDNDLPPF